MQKTDSLSVKDTALAPPSAVSAVSGTSASNAKADLTVLYDGSCPLCRREISIYQGLQARQALEWRDISAAACPLPGGGDRSTFMARFHVLQADGTVLSGARAFLALWATLPGWRWLAKLGSLPGMPSVLEWIYRRFLIARPWLQKTVVAFENRQARR